MFQISRSLQTLADRSVWKHGSTAGPHTGSGYELLSQWFLIDSYGKYIKRLLQFSWSHPITTFPITQHVFDVLFWHSGCSRVWKIDKKLNILKQNERLNNIVWGHWSWGPFLQKCPITVYACFISPDSKSCIIRAVCLVHQAHWLNKLKTVPLHFIQQSAKSSNTCSELKVQYSPWKSCAEIHSSRKWNCSSA